MALDLFVFKDEKTPISIVVAELLKEYSNEDLHSLPFVLLGDISAKLGFNPSALMVDKIYAAVLITTTDTFEHDWRTFEHICHLFNDQLVSFDTVQPLQAEELATALAEYSQLDDKLEFSSEIARYCGIILEEYGLRVPPPLLAFAIFDSEIGDPDLCKEKKEALQDVIDSRQAKLLELAKTYNSK